jgi:hypothetical protein
MPRPWVSSSFSKSRDLTGDSKRQIDEQRDQVNPLSNTRDGNDSQETWPHPNCGHTP